MTGSIPDRHFGDTPVALPVAGGQNLPVTVERCDQCGFDSEDWDDATAIGAVVGLPARWVEAVSGLTSNDSHRRPVADMWSVAEYADHVREVLFSMRFLLDIAVARPGGPTLGRPRSHGSSASRASSRSTVPWLASIARRHHCETVSPN